MVVLVALIGKISGNWCPNVQQRDAWIGKLRKFADAAGIPIEELVSGSKRKKAEK